MLFRYKIFVFGFLSLVWIANQSSCEQDTTDCDFHYQKVNWTFAVDTCEADDKNLLCYKSKKDIDDITEIFKLSAYKEASLELWLSHRNCSKQDEEERCLSLHIQKSKNGVLHFFQRDCRINLPFACCVKEGYNKTTATIITSTTTPSVNDTTDSNISSSKSIISSSSTTTHKPTESLQCKGIKKRGLEWPDTNIGSVAILPCPGRSKGKAEWACDGQDIARWQEDGPDYTKCRSLDILNIKEKFNTSTAVDTIDLIGNAFEDHEKEIFGEDLADVISMMTYLPERLFSELGNLSNTEKWDLVKDTAEKTTSVIDHMIELPSTWNDIPQKRRPLVGTELLSTVEGYGIVLADTMIENIEEYNVREENMALQVLRAPHGQSMELPQWTNTSHYSQKGHIMLDQGFDKHLKLDEGNVSVVFTLYSNITNILHPQRAQKKGQIRSSLNSAVLSATVTQARKTVPVDSQVRILVEHLTQNANNTACVFWNMTINDWDTEGCRKEEENDIYTLCVCNHLTNFAVLMDYRGILSDVDQLSFHYITIIGCTLSIICLAICVIIFTCYSYYSRHSWGLRYVIHRNLCLTLLIANLVLVIGIDQTENQRICAIVAGMLHYFFLSAFCWMLLEGVHIYLLLVVVFASRRSHWEKYYLFGYGFPLIIVTITALSRPMYYGTDEVCWLSIEKGTIWAFMGPVACILMLNVAALILAQYKASNISINDDNVALIKRWLRITFILFPILGITWLFGFMYVGKRYIAIGYIFAILNSLQGFCIFVCHCLMDKKARNMVISSLKKKSASVTTGSTGTQRKQNDSNDNVNKESHSSQNGLKSKEKDINKPSLFSFHNRKAFSKCHKPWSFCFELPVTEKKSDNCQKPDEVPPKPLVLQWNNLKD